MNRKAIACFIWAAVLFVAALILGRYDSQFLDVFNRIIGPDNFGTTRWVLQVDSELRWMLSTTPAVLIGAGVVIQSVAPKKASPATTTDAGVDAAA